MFRALCWTMGAVALVLAGAWLVCAIFPGPRADRESQSAQHPAKLLPAGISQADYDQAQRQFEAAYRRSANHHDVYSWLGEAAFKQEDWPTALASFEQIPAETARYGHIATLFQGRALLKLQQASKTEGSLREFLRLEQSSPELSSTHVAEALLQLHYLLGIELRFEERKPVLEALIELGFFEHEEILNYCFPTLHRWNGNVAADALEEFWKHDPQNARLRVARGRYRQGQGLLEEARQILEECRSDYPRSITTAAALLACLHESEDWNEMIKIMHSLPPPQDSQPWLLLRMRGYVHTHQSEFAEAIDCFQRVLKSNPADAESWLGLSAAHAGLNDNQEHARCAQQASDLSRIQNRIGKALDHPNDAEVLLEIAELAASIDLVPEALLVIQLGLKKQPKHEKLLELQRRLSVKASPP